MTNEYKSICTNTPSFMLLPVELQTDIFLRLPLTSLYPCKRVCKAFRTLIENPDFISTSYSLLLQVNHETWGLVSIHSTTKDVISYTILIPRIPYVGKLSLVGSSNGLVCFVLRTKNYGYYGYKCHDVLLLWNPFIEQNRFIPVPDFDGYVYQPMEFYFVPETNDYVVLSIGYLEYMADQINVAAYRMRTRAWEIVDQIQLGPRFSRIGGFNDYSHREEGTSVVLNGCFHWIFTSTSEASVIVSFNIRDEKLRGIKCTEHNWIHLCFIGIMDESLAALCRNVYKNVLEIYVMSNYEVDDSWVLKYKKGPDGVWLKRCGENSGIDFNGRHSMYFYDKEDLKKKIMKVISSPEWSCLSGFSRFSSCFFEGFSSFSLPAAPVS